jgi:hypothetical protein
MPKILSVSQLGVTLTERLLFFLVDEMIGHGITNIFIVKLDIHGSVHRDIIYENDQQDANV